MRKVISEQKRFAAEYWWGVTLAAAAFGDARCIEMLRIGGEFVRQMALDDAQARATSPTSEETA